MFSGLSGMSIAEWTEEVQACMWAHHLSGADNAFFIFDHLARDASGEIKFRASTEREDPAQILAVLNDEMK